MTSVEVENSHSFTEKEQPEAKKQKQEEDIMKFGKYKGQSIKDILQIKEMKFNKLQETGTNYLLWCLKQDFIRPETKEMIKKYIN